MRKLRKVEWVVFVQAESAEEAAGFAAEIQLDPRHTAQVYRVDGELIDLEGDEPSQNAWCYDDNPVPPITSAG